jgi:HD-GYP domain-containing protein (c-di-GMP phosphodiesterase class II)
MMNYIAFFSLVTIIFGLIAWLLVLFPKVRFFKKEIVRFNNKIGKTPTFNSLLSLLIGIDDFSLKTARFLNKDDFVDSVVKVANKLVQADSITLMLKKQGSNELYIAASKGFPENLKSSVCVRIGEGISGVIARKGQPTLVVNIEKDLVFCKKNNDRYRSKSFISVPLKVENRVLGVLNVNASSKIKRFEEKDLIFLTILAHQVAISLENIELNNNIRDFCFEIVQTLVRTIDAKDSYTFAHASRARHYAKLIAEKIGLFPEIVNQIEYAALMHDIGKIGISESILQKNNSLTNQEKDIMKMHPIIGYNVIAPMTFLSSVAPMVLYHQEWYNGNGYPEGLSGEEIPLGARIIAVIDAYDAMTSNRPYRKSLGEETAIAELIKGAEKQFDPKVVDIFVNILKSDKDFIS